MAVVVSLPCLSKMIQLTFKIERDICSDVACEPGHDVTNISPLWNPWPLIPALWF